MKRIPTFAFAIYFVSLIILVNFSCTTDSEEFLDKVLEAPEDSPGDTTENQTDGQDTTSEEFPSLVLSPVDDAFVQGDNGYNQRVVRIEANERTAYFKFDLSMIEGEIKGAHVEFTTNDDPGDGNIAVMKGLSNDWSEENLTARNAPSKGEKLGSIEGTFEVGSLHRIPIDHNALEASVFSVILDKDFGNDISISSKENPDSPGPKLIVEYDGTINQEVLDQVISESEAGGLDEEPAEETMNGPVITLNSLKAFPSAFGAAADIDGGRGGTIYEVTNLNSSGPGSFRQAFQASGKRIIIVKVEGIVDKGGVQLGSNSGDVTIWGQFAPGRGLTLDNGGWTWTRSGNIIIRHITSQNKNIDCTVNVDCLDGLNLFTMPSNTGIYVDHTSMRYGADQTFGVALMNENLKITTAYNVFAEGIPSHNTGAIFFTNNYDYSSGSDVGDHTFARNMFYNVSHRFPNMDGSNGVFEVYNNFIVNWKARLSRCNGTVNVDWHDNYAMAGNMEKSNAPLNKWAGNANEWSGRSPSIFSSGNFIEGYDEVPSSNQQRIWQWFRTTSHDLSNVPSGVKEKDTQLPASLFSTSKHANFERSNDGVWSWNEIPSKMEAGVGHNRGINANGSPGFFRDDLDADYIRRSLNNSTPSRYREPGEWTDSSFTNTGMYKDSDGDHMPDWFENRHAHLNPNDASDMLSKHVNWNFENYSVRNNAGYSNLEICAEFYAGGFETMLDGTTKID